MGRTDCTEPQCLYSRAIPLLPLWAVRTVQSLSACTVELYLYSTYSTAIPLLPLWAVRILQSLSACTVQLYLYSPQYLYSTAIPLLPLWAVRPVQTLSACTVQLYLYSPYGPYGLYRASVRVQGCTLPLPLLYWTLSVVGSINCLVVEGRTRFMFLLVAAARSPVRRASLPTEFSRFFNDAYIHSCSQKVCFLQAY